MANTATLSSPAAWRHLFAGRTAWAGEAGPAYRLLAVEVAVIAVLVAVLGFRVDGDDFQIMAMLLSGTVGIAWAMRWCRMGQPADALEAGSLVMSAAMAVGSLSVVLGTIAPPYRDAALAGADGWLFPLSWPTMARWLGGHPALVTMMSRVYATLLWQPFALVALLAAIGERASMWRFVRAWMLALIACVAVFALVPAATAQVHYGFAPGSIPGLTVDAAWRPFGILERVRSGDLRMLSAHNMAGMVDFPSFHAAGAVMIGWGARQAGRLGWPLIALAALMFPTIPLIGSHYFVDMFAGVLVALMAIRATRPVQASRIT
jgi:hypothetical protein